MSISLIVAMAENGTIARGGALPWHLPADLGRFKALTTGHAVVMGRKTYESLGRPLPDRLNLVLTRDPGFHRDGVIAVGGLEEALHYACGDEQTFIIGGADVYRQAFPYADRVYQTLVHAHVDGDAGIGELDLSGWRLVEDVRHDPDDQHRYPFSFRVLERPKEGPAPLAQRHGPGTGSPKGS